MAINERLVHTASAAAGTGNQEEGLVLHLDANDVDSYDGDGDVWYDIHDHEYTPATNVSEHFNTVTYTGTGSTNAITSVGFQPDLIWIKNRDTTDSHAIVDSVRGITSPAPYIASDRTDAQATSTNMPTSVQSNGFTITGGGGRTNTSGEDYVAWCFNAGGNEVTNTDGTVDSTVRANNDLGFSIVKYNGLSTAVTAGHGLDSPPDMVICKPLATGAWAVWHKDMASDLDKNYIPLTTGAVTANASSLWNYSNWGATKIGSSNPLMFGTNNDIVAYCFTSKRGVSKVGSYIGNGTTSNKIYTGFEPAFLMFKGTDQASDWIILDNKRDTSNPNSARLDANSNGAEYTGENLVDFNRDGFTLVTSSASKNGSNNNFIYYAVAKNTNETGLIPDTDLELNLEADSYSGSGNWLDSSGNGNNGTITGATWEEELGNFFDLDGSGDYIDVPTSGVLNGDFTVEMWWNFDTLSDGYRMLLGGSGYSSGSGLGHYIENSRLRTWVSVNGSTSNVLNGSGTDLTTNKWQHVVLTRSGGTYTQYIDTNQVGQATGTTASLESTNSRIGGHYNATGFDINAKVGQVRIYSSALSQAQIRQNYNFTKNDYPNEIHGTINNSTFLPGTSGEVDAFDFNGSNSSVSLNSSAFSQNTYTIAAWFKLDALDLGGIFEWGDAASYERRGLIVWDGGSGNYKLYSSTYASNVPANTNLAANNWYHGAVTMDNGSASLYLNGQPDGTGTNTLASYTGTTGYVGRTQVGEYLDGKVSEVKVYNRVLTASEIEALYNEGNG